MFACALAVLVPLGAGAGTPSTAFVPQSLLDEAKARPDATFPVIVQGAAGWKSANVATDVSAEVAATPGNARGVKRKFALISGVTAELTGKQILKLAERPWISAITQDAPVAASDSTPPATAGTPTVSGTAQDGATLTVDAGTWTGDPTPAYSYEWQRCDGPSRRAGILADAPIGFWPLDDANGATAADASGHGLAGTYAPGVSVVADGPDGAPAARLDGLTAGVTVPGVSNAALTSGFTIEAWVKVASAQANRGIAGKWVWDDGGGALLWINENGNYTLVVNRSFTAYLFSNVAPAVGTWQHVAGTWDGATLRLFIDGKEVASRPWTDAIGAPTGPFMIGDYTGDPHNLDGSIADVAVYDHALPAGRIEAHDSGCRAIAGATGASYTASAADVGATLRVAITGTNVLGSVTSLSGRTGAVAPAPPAPDPPSSTAPPTVSGTAQDGQTLTADPGTWTSAVGTTPVISYRWRACDATGASCSDIASATAATYTASAGDVGKTLVVAVTATDSAGSTTASSAPTPAVVPTAPASSAAPAVIGTAQEARVLSVDQGTWSGTAPITFAYQWQRCDTAGACGDIAGATGATYAPTQSDVHDTIRVTVTATNAAGTAKAVSGMSASVAALRSRQLWPYVTRSTAAWAATAPAPTIAIVDSGVDAARADFGDRVQQVTLTSLVPNSSGDGRGHGTLVAGIAAGAADGYTGVEPAARLIALDVMDDHGMATVGDVIAAADWIYAHKDAFNIRVANLSLQAAVPSSFQYDPLDKAVETLWLSGVTVVAAAGNYAQAGQQSGVPFAPGNDPFVISVGATDTADTLTTADDFVAPWSAYGYTPDGFAKPELSAPGRYIVGPVPPDSTLVQEHPDRVVAPGYMQMSGTSFSAPMVSGAASYLLSLHPAWTPDQVKGALMLTAAPLPAAVPMSAGTGELDVAAAASVGDPPNPNLPLNQFLVPDPGGGPTPIFDSGAWGSAVQSGAWGSGAWGSGAWGSGAWGSGAWGSGAWGSAYWSSGAWGSGVQGAMGTTAASGADSDALASGGYWLTPAQLAAAEAAPPPPHG